MSEVVLARGSPIAPKLAELGYARPGQLRDRYDELCKSGSIALPSGTDEYDIKRVIFISRVSVGTDAAVSSVFLRAAYLSFRRAAIEFIGPKKNAYLLGSGRSIGQRLGSYNQAGLLGDRLKAWLRIRKAVEKSVDGLGPGEWFVVDPDSPFTQLGLLPVTDDEYYGFFGTRDYPTDIEEPLGSLAIGARCVGWYDLDEIDLRVFPSPAGRPRSANAGSDERSSLPR